MVNKVKNSEEVVKEWIIAVEEMKNLESPFAHLVVGLVEPEIKAQKKD